jgi:hypothetical protein
MNPTVATIRRLFGSGGRPCTADEASFDPNQHPRGGDPKHPGQFSKGSGSAGGTSSEGKTEGAAKVWSAKSATPEQKTAIKIYTAEYYRPINMELRGIRPDSGKYADTVHRLDEIISSSSYEGMLYRGIGGGYAKELEKSGSLRKGAVIEDFGFVSTSKQESVARSFSSVSREGILVKIVAPKGSRVADVGPLSDDVGENEAIAARGSRMRVKSFNKKKRELEVELLPPVPQGAKDSVPADSLSPIGRVNPRRGKKLAERWAEDDGAGVRVTLPNGKKIVLGRRG